MLRGYVLKKFYMIIDMKIKVYYNNNVIFK